MFTKEGLDLIANDAGVPTLDNPAVLVSKFIDYIFAAAGIILILSVISTGYRLMTSVGDPKAVGAAQAKITNAVLGILIMALSFGIVKFILQFFGIELTLFNILT